MPTENPAQVAFNAGIWSPNLDGRIDLAKYRSACSEMRNFVPLISGAARKRSGTRFVGEVKDSADNVRLVSFEFSTVQAYILEFGDLYMRVYRDGGIVLDGGGPSVFEVATPYAHTELDDLYFSQSADVLYVAHPDHAPVKISRTDHDAWTVEEIAFDWEPFQPDNFDEQQGFAVSGVESSVTITSSAGRLAASMVGGVIKLRELIGSNNGEWEAASANTDYDGTFGANARRFFDGNVYEKSGSGATTGTSPPKHLDGVRSDGKVLWKYLHSGEGYVRITSVTDAYRATGAVVKRIPESVVYVDVAITAITNASNAQVTTSGAHDLRSEDLVYIQGVNGMTEVNQRAYRVVVNSGTTFLLQEDSTSWGTYTSGGICVRVTPRFSMGAWNDQDGYPRCVTFYEDRLVWAGSRAHPQTLWLSRSGDYENHQQSPDEDEGALVFTINTDQVNVIEAMSAADQLMLMTAGAEFTLSASNPDQALSAGNVRAVRRNTRGSRDQLEPVRVGSAVLFVQRSGRKLLELIYDFDTDGLNADDLTILSETVTQEGLRKIAYQQEPDRVLWCVLDDGQLVGFSYEREQEVTAWHRHPIGGTDVVVESVAVIPHPDGDSDQVWLVVRRTVDGGTVRYVEYIEKEWLEIYDQEDGFFVDCGLSYDGAPATTISGLDHLEGETVTVLADGKLHPQREVSGGQITLEYAASVVQAGLHYDAELQTMRMEAGVAQGVAQGKTKRIDRCAFRLYQCGIGFQHGPSLSGDLEEELFVQDIYDAAVPLFDGDTDRLLFDGDYEQDGRVAFKHRFPLPCTLIAVFPEMTTYEGG